MRRTLALALVLACPVLAGCSKDGEDASTTAAAATGATVTAAGETYEVVDAATVSAGLTTLVALAKAAAATASSGGDAAEAASVALYDKWYEFEGTIRRNDQSMYLDMEDALVAVKAGATQGNSAKAVQGATDLESLAAAYRAQFPADGAADASPASPASRSVGVPVAVQLADYAVIVRPTLERGPTTFTFTNVGAEVHEFVVFRTDLAMRDLPTDAEGGVDEKGAGVTLVNEKENVKPGTSGALTVDLEPGGYVFVCNLLGHYAKGMSTAVTVR
jgi:uncharacterized cupredoxin-like copper-binding protein